MPSKKERNAQGHHLKNQHCHKLWRKWRLSQHFLSKRRLRNLWINEKSLRNFQAT
jgi:hypothetical protein